ELLPASLLSWGNGVLELGTFLALIAGSVTGAFLADAFAGRQLFSGAVFLSLSLVGLLVSLGISRVPAADPVKKFRINVFGDLWAQTALIRSDRVLWLAVLGNTYFWFLGAVLQFNIILYGQDVLKISSTHNGILQVSIATGIGLGSLAAGFLSSGQIEYGLIPLGSLGMTGLGLLLALGGLSFGEVLVLLAVRCFDSLAASSSFRSTRSSSIGPMKARRAESSLQRICSPSSALPWRRAHTMRRRTICILAPRQFFCGLRWQLSPLADISSIFCP